MTDERPARSIEVGQLVVPDAAPGVLYSLLEVFCSVGTAWEELTGTPAGATRMRARLVAETDAPLRCLLGVTVQPHVSFAAAPHFDVVLVTDLGIAADLDPRGRWPAASEWLRGQYQGGATVASVCTGSVLLAEAGLLDDLQATSHWAAQPLFRRHYPRVRLQPDKVLALAGAEQRIITAGGAGSWVELALYLIGRYCGQAEAHRTARVFVLGDRSDGQLPFAAMVRPAAYTDAIIEQCQAWIAEHYDRPNPVTRMIEHSGLSPRRFSRRFLAATGYTPIAYVQTLRVEEAKQLLESTALGIEALSATVGYDDATFFRRLFKRMTGVTPARYRQRARGIGLAGQTDHPSSTEIDHVR